LIRNLLEDSFALVGNVVDNVDAIAQDAIGLGKQAGADAQRLARRASNAVGRENGEASEEDDDGEKADAPDLSHVLAWQSVVFNSDQNCCACTKALPRGTEGFLGITASPGSVEWLCANCRNGLA
jgi:hypothetical protein